MALWTPYSPEGVLDLSKTTAVKIERVSPIPSANQAQMSGGYMYPQYNPEVYHLNVPPAYHQYAPPAQFSPESASSTCSNYDSISYPADLQQRIRPASSLSPPDSPESSVQRAGRLLLDVEQLTDDPEYQAFERDALRVMAERNGGSLLGNNPRMRRAVKSTNQNPADNSYKEQRERNNLAAKQSRDRRKLREVRLALEVTYLSKQVNKLRAKLAEGVCSRCQQ